LIECEPPWVAGEAGIRFLEGGYIFGNRVGEFAVEVEGIAGTGVPRLRALERRIDMEVQFAAIDEQLVKLEAEADLASGEAKRVIEEQIEVLRQKRQEIAALQDDVTRASGEENELQGETEVAEEETREDIP
jgi:hypothetical protein